jgi:hypothetical protein
VTSETAIRGSCLRMDLDELRGLLEKLTGRSAPGALLDTVKVLQDEKTSLGYSQLNELLLLLGFDRVSRSFFRFLLDGEIEYQEGLSFGSENELKSGVDRFIQLAMLAYGNIKFAFKILSTDSEELATVVRSSSPIPEESFFSRHEPVLSLIVVPPEDAYLTGYLIREELKKHLEEDPNNPELQEKEKQRQITEKMSTDNQVTYLTWDHLDVYVATSMRQRHEFISVDRFTKQLFGSPELVPLKLRWFNPTQACCIERLDKGLSEALMLKRANATVYLAQETDTLGKDSELASTLAQGKPVIAYVPEVTDSYFNEFLGTLHTASPDQAEWRLCLDQMRIFFPDGAWIHNDVRRWSEPGKDFSTELEAIKALLMQKMIDHYNKRAESLKETHPLAIQVNLATGVANGVLVVRSIEACGQLLRNILTRNLRFEIDNDSIPGFVLLREELTKCIFRVVTKDQTLTNAFWNFYLDPAE